MTIAMRIRQAEAWLRDPEANTKLIPLQKLMVDAREGSGDYWITFDQFYPQYDIDCRLLDGYWVREFHPHKIVSTFEDGLEQTGITNSRRYRETSSY